MNLVEIFKQFNKNIDFGNRTIFKKLLNFDELGGEWGYNITFWFPMI